MTIRVVVADECLLSLHGMATLLSNDADVYVVGLASNGHECLRLVSRLSPDVVLLDAQLPMLNGIEVARRGRSRDMGSHFIILSQSRALVTVRAAMDAGACGFLLRSSCGVADMMQAVRAAAANRVYLSPEVARTLVDDYRGSDHLSTHHLPRPLLTPREREVTQMLSEGYPTKEIAARLHVSPKTVGTHREHIQLKLGLSSMAELTRYAIIEGLSRLDTPCYAQGHTERHELID